jgi:outer membrane lipoprotein-sorting protein
MGAMLALLCGVAAASDWNVAALMQTLAQTKSGRASFVEKKYIGIIDKPIESAGELTFTAPDKLEKRTTRPKMELLSLDGDRLVVEQADRRRLTLSLQEYPDIAAFVESIRGTLSGDRRTLERFYTLELSGSADKWQLSLVPTQERMLAVVSRIRIAGSHANVKSIGFEQADGDRSEMTISRVVAQ